MSTKELNRVSRLNVLVGGAGFVGSHLAQFLLNLNQAVLVLDKVGSYLAVPGCQLRDLPPLELRASTRRQFQDIVRESTGAALDERGGFRKPALSACYLAALDQKVPRALNDANVYDQDEEQDVFDALDMGVAGAIFFGHALREWVVDRWLDRLLFFSSIYGSVAPDQRIYGVSADSNWKPAHYSASRSAIQGVARHFASLYGIYGCSSNCIVPGGIENGQDPGFVESYSQKSMFGRMVRIEEVSSAAAFLLGSSSSGITGQAIHVDGGFTSW